MTIKETLKEAKRYEDIINILKNIISDNQISYPVHIFIGKDGKAESRVNGHLVRKEAAELLRIIEEDCNVEYNTFSNLFQYVESQSDMLLHNYAVSISHRKEPDIDMEVIRIWEILDNLLLCGFDIDEDGEYDWYIPDGWKRIE